MSQTQATKLFIQTLQQHQQNILNVLEELIKILPLSNEEKKTTIAKQALDAVDYLNALIPNNQPAWSNPLSHQLGKFVEHPTQFASNLNSTLVHYFPSVKSYDLTHLLEDNNSVFDIDEIYKKCRDESNLPALFDKIINILEQLCSSEDIDSKSMVKALEKLLKSLEKSKNGSLISIKNAWEFLKIFLENYIIGELEKIPALGTLLVALINTTNEMSDEIIQLDKKVQEEARHVFEEEIKSLPRGSSLHITYTQEAKLSIPTSLSQFNQKV